MLSYFEKRILTYTASYDFLLSDRVSRILLRKNIRPDRYKSFSNRHSTGGWFELEHIDINVRFCITSFTNAIFHKPKMIGFKDGESVVPIAMDPTWCKTWAINQLKMNFRRIAFFVVSLLAGRSESTTAAQTTNKECTADWPIRDPSALLFFKVVTWSHHINNKADQLP